MRCSAVQCSAVNFSVVQSIVEGDHKLAIASGLYVQWVMELEQTATKGSRHGKWESQDQTRQCRLR